MSAAAPAGAAFLLDTCVLSELMRPAPEPAVIAWIAGQRSDRLHLSAVSLAELWQGIEALPIGRQRRGLAATLTALLEHGLAHRVLPFGAAEAITLGCLVQERRLQGRPIGWADAQIAATARHGRLVLVTRHDKDFAASGVVVVNPWRG